MIISLVYYLKLFFSQMLDDFVDVTKDEKEMMHMWNSFVRKQQYVSYLFLIPMMSSLTSNKFRGICGVCGLVKKK